MSLAEQAFDVDWEPKSTVISDLRFSSVQFEPTGSKKMSVLEVPEWTEIVHGQLEYIQSLKMGWDGFGAYPIRRDVLAFMATMLDSMMQWGTPSPHIAPMSHEGVQVEWHVKGIDLEIEIEAPGEVWVSCEIDDEENDWSLTTDFGSLADVIIEITKRA